MRSFLLHTLWISLFLMLSSMAQATSNCTPTVCPYTVSEQAKQPLNQHVLMFEAPSDWTIEQVHEAYLNQQFRPALGHRIQTLQRQHKAAVADAQLDPLTDILNRRGLDHAFQRIVQNGKGEVALLLLDLNKFKAVNDTYGHDVGDILLQAVAARIQHATRGQDAVARLGGDEYAILLHHAHVNDALARVKERLQKAFAEPVHHQGLTLHIDTCVGIAQSPVASADYNALYRQADQALYQQKQALKNTQLTAVNEANA